MTNDTHKTGLTALKRAADTGAEEARLDGQGFLREEPKRDSPLTEYERLMEALYGAALCARENTPDCNFVELGDFVECLENYLEPEADAAAHQIREGIRDAYEKPEPRKTWSDADVAKERDRLTQVQIIAGGLTTPEQTDPTTQQPFTEEEMRHVRFDLKNGGWSRYSDLAPVYNLLADGMPSARDDYKRLAACARYLAEGE